MDWRSGILGSGNATFWIALIRATLAFSLGVTMLLMPDKTGPKLANFIGMYWLIGSILSLRWDASGRRARGLSLLSAVVGVIAGLILLSRGLTLGWAAEATFFFMLGLVILLTGLIHVFGGVKTGRDAARKWSWASFLLGIFEVVLGLLVVIRPLARGPLISLSASIWALLGGLILIGDAIRIRRLGQKKSLPDKKLV